MRDGQVRVWVLALLALLALLAGCVDPELHEECQVNTDCPEGMQCSFSNCIPLEDCPEDNQTRCGDQCVNTASDPDHCGSCEPCPDLANARALSCIQGQCQYTCENGYQDADGDLARGPLGTGCECPPGEACSSCPAGCGELEVCRQGRCVQVECVEDETCALPGPVCEGNSVISWVGSGACVNNECDRQRQAEPCGARQVCSDAACVQVDCTQDADCPAPAPSCEGAVAVSYLGNTGTCVNNVCDFTDVIQRLDCDLGRMACVEGQCTDLCQDVECPIPAPVCQNNVRVLTTQNECDYRTGECQAETQNIECSNPDTCQRGYCAPLGSTIILPGELPPDSSALVHRIERVLVMQESEVTRQSYVDVVGVDTSTYTSFPDQPVNNVTWLQATRYARLLSLRQNLEPCYDDSGMPLANILGCQGWRLPTAHEWQRAYRAGTDTFWFCGLDPECLLGVANCNGETEPSRVRQRFPNPWGLYDMAGNVWEWVHDWHSGTDLAMSTTDYTGPQQGQFRRFFGGSSVNDAAQCGATSSFYLEPDRSLNSIGFRLVRTLPQDR